MRIRLGEVQYDQRLSIIFDLRHKRSDLLGDRLPSRRSYPRCPCLRVCPSCHRHDHPGTIIRPASRARRGRGGPGTRWARDKWPAPRSRRVTRPCCPPRDGRLPTQGPTPARGRPVTGRRPLPDPVPVEAELRWLARETLDPGEVGPSELPLERPGCLLVAPFEGEESTLHLPEIDEVVRGEHLTLDDGESRFQPGSAATRRHGWRRAAPCAEDHSSSPIHGSDPL